MPCKLRVLGCSGGIAADLRTTSLLIDDHILIDAGTGVGDLTIDELRQIDHVFLTHSHLDHICSIPFIADAVGALRNKPLKVYGIYKTIHALQEHILNDVIWPDFTKIPTAKEPFISLHLIELQEPIKLGGLTITALPVDHSIEANAYAVSSNSGTVVFSGDTGVSDRFWNSINQSTDQLNAEQAKLKHLIIETSFPDREESLAIVSGHLSPSLLIQELRKLDINNCHSDFQIWICHLKPDGGDAIMQEINALSKELLHKPSKLTRGATLEF